MFKLFCILLCVLGAKQFCQVKNVHEHSTPLLSNSRPSEEKYCRNPKLFVWQLNGFYTFNKANDYNYILLQNITIEETVYDLTVDHSGKHIYMTNEAGMTVYSRITCKDQFTNKSSILNEYFGNSMTIDPTGCYLFQSDLKTFSLTAFQINQNGSLTSVHSFNLNRSEDGDLINYPVFYPKRNDLMAVSHTFSPVINFYKFESSDGSMKNLSLQVTLPSPMTAHRIAFSADGKYMYVVGKINKVCIFEIKTVTGAIGNIEIKQMGDLISTIPAGVTEKNEKNIVRVHPQKNIVYIWNDTPNSLAIFEIVSNAIKVIKILTDLPTKFWDFIVTPHGTQLIAVSSASVFVYSIDQDGLLKLEKTIPTYNARSPKWYHA